jgi:hypothetical protein
MEINVFQNHSGAAMYFDARNLHHCAVFHAIPKVGYRLSNSVGQRSGYALGPHG